MKKEKLKKYCSKEFQSKARIIIEILADDIDYKMGRIDKNELDERHKNTRMKYKKLMDETQNKKESA